MTHRFRNRLVGLLAMGLLPLGAAQAQLAPDSARLAVKVDVPRLFLSSYGLEVECRYGRQFSIALLPRVLAGPVPPSVSTIAHDAGDEVRGYSIGFSPRFYIPNTGAEGAKLAGLYVGLRADLQHLNLSYQKTAWGEDLADNGLLYYNYRPRDFSETISRTGGAIIVGIQAQLFHPRLRIDCSASLNRVSSVSSAGEASRYRTSNSDYAYSGSFWTLGLGFGFVVK